MENFTTTQALENLDKIASEYKGTRADHVLLQQSIQLLASYISASNKLTSSIDNAYSSSKSSVPPEVKDVPVTPPFPIEY